MFLSLHLFSLSSTSAHFSLSQPLSVTPSLSFYPSPSPSPPLSSSATKLRRAPRRPVELQLPLLNPLLASRLRLATASRCSDPLSDPPSSNPVTSFPPRDQPKRRPLILLAPELDQRLRQPPVPSPPTTSPLSPFLLPASAPTTSCSRQPCRRLHPQLRPCLHLVPLPSFSDELPQLPSPHATSSSPATASPARPATLSSRRQPSLHRLCPAHCRPKLSPPRPPPALPSSETPSTSSTSAASSSPACCRRAHHRPPPPTSPTTPDASPNSPSSVVQPPSTHVHRRSPSASSNTIAFTLLKPPMLQTRSTSSRSIMTRPFRSIVPRPHRPRRLVIRPLAS